MKPYTRLRIIIADDHEMLREGLHVMISKIDEIEIIEEAANGEQLIALTSKLLPDVVLTDVKMPVLDGIEATKFIKQNFPHIGVIALSSFDEEGLITEMLNAGANGYLLKNSSKKEITEAVRAASVGNSYYCKETTEKLSQLIAKGGIQSIHEKPIDKFTQRELEVIAAICDGLSSKEIATRLGLETRTIERYRDKIMEKMEVSNVASLVKFALTKGLYNHTKNKI